MGVPPPHDVFQMNVQRLCRVPSMGVHALFCMTIKLLHRRTSDAPCSIHTNFTQSPPLATYPVFQSSQLRRVRFACIFGTPERLNVLCGHSCPRYSMPCRHLGVSNTLFTTDFGVCLHLRGRPDKALQTATQMTVSPWPRQLPRVHCTARCTKWLPNSALRPCPQFAPWWNRGHPTNILVERLFDDAHNDPTTKNSWPRTR